MNKKINFFDNGITKIRNKTKLKKWMIKCINDHEYNLKIINYILCSKEEIKMLNKKYLQKNNYTDIIAFNYEDKKNIFADIYMCYEIIKENSKVYSVNLSEEIHRVMIHGILHLCGFKDFTKKEKEKIQVTEDLYLKKLKKEI
tara:strand:- start:2956 stop:3384 length:429 start_codon:yes stop_codon:yes gene_type:complete